MTLSPKDKIQLAVTGALVLVLVLVVGHGLRKRPVKSSPAAVPKSPPVAPTPSVPPEAQAPAMLLKLKEEARTLPFKRDPFLRQAAVSLGRGGPSLSGIAWDEEDPTAIINGRIARRGDSIDGYTVVDIRKDGVTLHDGVEELEIQWDGE